VNFAELAQEGYSRWLEEGPSLIAVDTETEGVAFYDRPFCVTIAWGGVGHYFELSKYDSSDMVREILSCASTWLFHNAKFDLQKLILSGIIEYDELSYDRFEDTEGLAHLLDEHRRKGLKVLARELLGEETDEEEVLKKVRREMKLKKSDGYHVLPREVVIPYAIADVVLTERLFNKLRPQLDRFPDLVELYGLEREVTLVLLAMESAGMALDMKYLDKTTKEYALEAVKTELDIRDLVRSEEFNPNSPKQVIEAFEKRGVSLEKTDADTLETLDDPLAEKILHLRSTRKTHGTYLTSLQEEQRDGLVHPWFRQYNTRTGRFASGGAAN
jgi:DNA polymerase I-like protein with 3'-5' exonuclease and polymerase domains